MSMMMLRASKGTMNAYRLLLIAATAFLLLSCKSNSEQNDLELVWADEFDCERHLSSNHWGYEEGFVRNRELQWYQRDNAYCNDGVLVLEAKRELVHNDTFDANSDNWRQRRRYAQFSSASVTTKGKHDWLYGVFEVRAKIKAEHGLWPAIWFLGAEGDWPSNGEIDLMEYYRGMILANVAWADKGRFRAIWDSRKIPISDFDDPKWEQKFHVWKMEWTESSIKLFVDDELLNEVSLKDTINQSHSQIVNPFHKPQYLRLNLAVGGQQGGSVSHTEFPSQFLIDYVRVYQKKP